jgi:hypothetical protein
MGSSQAASGVLGLGILRERERVEGSSEGERASDTGHPTRGWFGLDAGGWGGSVAQARSHWVGPDQCLVKKM